jgi:hypothetical protein
VRARHDRLEANLALRGQEAERSVAAVRGRAALLGGSVELEQEPNGDDRVHVRLHLPLRT